MPHTPLGTAGSSLSRVVLPPILAPGWRRLRLESMDHCRPLSLLPTHARRGPSPRFLFEHASHAAAHGTDMRKGTHIQCTAGAGPQHEPTPLPWRPPRTMRSGQEERRVEQSAVRDDAAHQRLSCAFRVNTSVNNPTRAAAAAQKASTMAAHSLLLLGVSSGESPAMSSSAPLHAPPSPREAAPAAPPRRAAPE